MATLVRTTSRLRPDTPWTADFMALGVYLYLIFFAPHERSAAIAALRPALLAAALTALFCVFRRPAAAGAERADADWSSRLLLALMAVLLAANVMSPFATEWMPQIFVDFLKLVALFFLIRAVLKTQEQVRAFGGLIMVLGGFIAVYSIFGYQFGFVEEHYRMISPFGGMGSNSNGYAMMLLGLLPFFLVHFNHEKDTSRKLVLAVVTLAVIMCIIKTRSRMGFLGIVLEFLVVAWYSRANVKSMVLVGLVVAFPILYANENLWERVSTISRAAQSEINPDAATRSNKWRQAFELIREYPLTGVGLGHFRDAVYTHDLGEYEHIVHNGYLEVGAESGVIAMFFFSAFIAVHLNQNRRLIGASRKSTPETKLVAESLFISMGALAFCLIFLSEQYNSMLFALAALSNATLTVTDRARDTRDDEGAESGEEEPHRRASEKGTRRYGERPGLSRTR